MSKIICPVKIILESDIYTTSIIIPDVRWIDDAYCAVFNSHTKSLRSLPQF